MRKKTIVILICMLLIGTVTIVVADWSPGDGHKMHYPQEPDPNGWDIDWGNWSLGDDWRCTECGTVNDIHFWISWWNDQEFDIQNIKISIWSNTPGTEYSMPKDELWSRTFYPDDFVIAGPWDGEQGWYNPLFGEYEPNNHFRYYQINIMDIEDPFKQIEGEIYWLVIQMPFLEYVIGWKTSMSDQFMDTAVYCLPGDKWLPIYDPVNGSKLDLAFVINGEPAKTELTCSGSLYWVDAINPGETITGTFEVCNNGETCSELKWEIDPTKPSFGTWTFTPANGILGSGDCVTVNVECVAPTNESIYIGRVKVFNSDDPSDFCNIDVYINTPRSRSLQVQILERLFERFPTVFLIFRAILAFQ
jgi:hypothetical protein